MIHDLNLPIPFFCGLRFEEAERSQLPAMLGMELEDRITVGEKFPAIVRLGREKNMNLALFARGVPLDQDVPYLHALNVPSEMGLGKGTQILLALSSLRTKLIRDVNKGRVQITCVDGRDHFLELANNLLAVGFHCFIEKSIYADEH